MKAFVSWSAGKESCLSLFKLQKKIKISCLFNMISEDGKHSRSHNLDKRLIQLQAKAIGIALIQRQSSWQTYEEVFKKTILELKAKGITTGIFGDIDTQAHRDWAERICRQSRIKALLPLWQKKRQELVHEFIDAGFKAIVVVTNKNYLGPEWLGRNIDRDFVADLKTKTDIDVAGERGEYHTFVYAGPIFKRAVKFDLAGTTQKDGYCFLEIIPQKDT